jgi:hypothetical protein
MPVCVGLIMPAAYFVSPYYSKAEYFLTEMNVKLLAANALLIQSGALLVSHNCFINFFAIVQY